MLGVLRGAVGVVLASPALVERPEVLESVGVHFTAVHRDGDVVVSVSTNRASPAFVQWVRERVTQALTGDQAVVAP